MKKKYPERRISSFKELKMIINALDLDDGVRVLGNISGLNGGGFIFISPVTQLIVFLIKKLICLYLKEKRFFYTS